VLSAQGDQIAQQTFGDSQNDRLRGILTGSRDWKGTYIDWLVLDGTTSYVSWSIGDKSERMVLMNSYPMGFENLGRFVNEIVGESYLPEVSIDYSTRDVRWAETADFLPTKRAILESIGYLPVD